MTDEEMKTTAAQTLLELSEERKRIACLKKRIYPFAEQLSELGSKLTNAPDDITASEGSEGLRFRWESSSTEEPVEVMFNPTHLVRLLTELNAANARLARVETALREMGHGHMLKD